MIEVRTTIGLPGVPHGSVIDVPDDATTARRIDKRIYIPTGAVTSPEAAPDDEDGPEPDDTYVPPVEDEEPLEGI